MQHGHFIIERGKVRGTNKRRRESGFVYRS